MPSSSAIKQKAKECLKNNFSAAFAVGFLALAVQALLLVFTGFIATLCNATVGQTVAAVIAAVFGAAAVLFLYLPILLGAVRWFWFSTGGSSVPPAEALHFFCRTDEYLKAVSLGLKLLIRLVLGALLCYLPALLLTVFSQPALYERVGLQMPYWLGSIWVFKNLFIALGSVALLVFMLRYGVAPVLLINNNKLSTAEALHLSTVVLKGQIGYTLGFILTLFGWFLLNLLFFPKLYSVPYFLSVYAVYVREIITHYNKQAALCNQTYFPNYRATL